MYNPLPNPMSRPVELIQKLLGFGFGYLVADMADRYTATHALTVATDGTITDAPKQGEIYDSEATLLPIWSNTNRLMGAASAIAAPMILGQFIWKETMSLVAIGAVVRTVGKALNDGVVALTMPTAKNPNFSPPPAVLRLYGGEAAAAQRLVIAQTVTPTAAPPATFAGVPRLSAPRLPAPRQLPSAQVARLRTLGDACGAQAPIVIDPLVATQSFLRGSTPNAFNNWGQGGGDDDCWYPMPLNMPFSGSVTQPSVAPDTTATPVPIGPTAGSTPISVPVQLPSPVAASAATPAVPTATPAAALSFTPPMQSSNTPR
jgi:hypothetical protein